MEDVQYDARTVQEEPTVKPMMCNTDEPSESMKKMTMRGTVTHRQSNRVLEFYFPRELADCLAPGEKFRAERAGQDWIILPGGGSLLHRRGPMCRIIVGDRPVARDLPYFGRREAEYIASGGQVLVRLLEPVSAMVDPDTEAVEVADLITEPTTEPFELASSLVAFLITSLGTNPAEADLRALLAALRHVEATTPLRLVREGDTLLWLARIE